MNYVKLMLLPFIVIAFSACAPQYNVVPNYDKENKVVTLDDFLLKNITNQKIKKKTSSTGSSTLYTRFNSDDNPCRKVAYRVYDAGKERYYSSSFIEDTLVEYDNDCLVEKIGNLNFSKCMNKRDVIENDDKYVEAQMHYAVSSSKLNQYGYGSKLKIYLGTDYKCYKKIKKHFKLKTDPQYIVTTNTFKKN